MNRLLNISVIIAFSAPFSAQAWTLRELKVKPEKAEYMMFRNQAGKGHQIKVTAYYQENGQTRLFQKTLREHWKDYFAKHRSVEACIPKQIAHTDEDQAKTDCLIPPALVGGFVYPRGVKFEKILIEPVKDTSGEVPVATSFNGEDFDRSVPRFAAGAKPHELKITDEAVGPYANAYNLNEHMLNLSVGIEAFYDEEAGIERLRYTLQPDEVALRKGSPRNGGSSNGSHGKLRNSPRR